MRQALALFGLLSCASLAVRGDDVVRVPIKPLRGLIDVDFAITADVPTRIQNVTFNPSQIVHYHGATATYSVVLTVPGEPRIAGIFKLDAPGSWLFSIEAPNDLADSLTTAATPQDIVRYDGGSGSYSRFFCGASVTGVIGPSSRVDAFYLEGGDTGSLVVSFDIPTRIGASTFLPTDLVRFTRTGATCASWEPAPSNPVFNSTAAGIAISKNSTGAARYGPNTILALDVPIDLGASVGAPAVPGEVVGWNGSELTVFSSLANWPIGSQVNGLSTLGNPGGVPDSSVRIAKSTATPGEIVVSWLVPSCSSGVANYGIYEGTIGNWSSHTRRTCVDTGADRSEQLLPSAGNRYYLVVPNNGQGEGSYGTRSGAIERPPATGPDACASYQIVSACPP